MVQSYGAPVSHYGACAESASSRMPFGAPQSGSAPLKRNASSSLFGGQASLATSPSRVLQDNATQLILLQQAKKKRLLMARQEPCSDAERQTSSTSNPLFPPPDSSASATLSILNRNISSSPQVLFHQLIHWQTFNGSFPYHSSAVTFLGISVEAFERTLQRIGQGSEDLVITALVIVYMKKRLEEFKGEWELVVEKAEAWVEDKLADLDVDVHAFLKTAEDLIMV